MMTDHEIVHDFGPVCYAHRPLFFDESQIEKQQFECGLFAGERAFRFRNFAHLPVYCLDRVGCVDDAADVFRVPEKCAQL